MLQRSKHEAQPVGNACTTSFNLWNSPVQQASVLIVDARVLPAMASAHGLQKRSAPRPQERRKSSPLPAPVCQAVTRFAAEFRKEHGVQDRSAADRIARLLKASITPRRPRGRPPTPHVRQAANLRLKGVSWQAIYPIAIEGHSSMDKYERTYQTDKLRRNVKAYLRRRGLRCPLPRSKGPNQRHN